MLAASTRIDRTFTVEFKDGLGNHISSYMVRSSKKWRNKIVEISKDDSQKPEICAAWTLAGRWQLLDQAFTCGCAFDKGELYGAEIVIRCE